MHDPSNHAREVACGLAARWREANEKTDGVVLLLDGQFVGWLAELPPAAQWAPGCLAVTEDSRVLLVRPAGWRGEVQWFEVAEDSEPDESVPESGETPLPS